MQVYFKLFSELCMKSFVNCCYCCYICNTEHSQSYTYVLYENYKLCICTYKYIYKCTTVTMDKDILNILQSLCATETAAVVLSISRLHRNNTMMCTAVFDYNLKYKRHIQLSTNIHSVFLINEMRP